MAPINSKQFIPLVDLKSQLIPIKKEIMTAMEEVVDNTSFVLGPAVSRFEESFAAFCGTRFAVGCGSGTDALHLACRALGIGRKDEVIMPAMTFVATAIGINMAGAKPVLADVDPDTALIDLNKAAACVTSKTKAIMPVHLYGQMVDAQALRDFAAKYNLHIIEDAAQAHGASSHGARAGSVGKAGCFSFYPGKNLGAYGDGGIVTTDDEEIFEKLKLWRNWGSRKKYYHEEMGLNSRLDSVQAAVLQVKLKYLDDWNNRRRELAAMYKGKLSKIQGVTLTKTDEDSVYHLYTIRVDRRDEVLKALNDSGIGAGIHYPIAVHQLGACQWLGHGSGDFPSAEDWAARTLSLPMYAELEPQTIDRIVEVVGNAVVS